MKGSTAPAPLSETTESVETDQETEYEFETKERNSSERERELIAEKLNAVLNNISKDSLIMCRLFLN